MSKAIDSLNELWAEVMMVEENKYSWLGRIKSIVVNAPKESFFRISTVGFFFIIVSGLFW